MSVLYSHFDRPEVIYCKYMEGQSMKYFLHVQFLSGHNLETIQLKATGVLQI